MSKVAKIKFKKNATRTLAEASQAPDTNVRISGDKERDMTSPVCPVNDVVCCPVSMSHKALRIKINDIIEQARGGGFA